MRFGLIGDGIIAKRHKEAIKHVGGELAWISDPIYPKYAWTVDAKNILTGNFPDYAMFNNVDYVVICSPSYLHREHTKRALSDSPDSTKIICEKPLCLPWEPIIDDDRINVCLQLRYIENLPKKADLVRAVMVRDDAFFKTWKGNPQLAGGNLYEFFIHYIDLAILLNADFEGQVLQEGKQVREIIYTKFDWSLQRNGRFILDMMQLDMQSLYDKMYEDILDGGGIKPKDIMYLMWILNQNSAKYGYRYAGFHNLIHIGKELL